jgi:hypothetical protein
MSKPMIRIHNIETDEIIDREMTDAEFAQHEKDLTNMAAEEAEAQAKADAKAAIAARLGLSSEELLTLLGQ